ncbi:helix-turn-helix transcriptional regulator [Actinomycetospora chlora]|jgi:transcriptional regulator with XRE-family HTH domain|uniref:Helix-turn-helix transcriptional regulator n=1 Tax=Actinomycetospora chlora TaxID=663608 RepID=A0ABP9CGC3_9PSEU
MATDGVDKIGQAVEDIGAYIRRQREGAEVSLRQLAKVAGISNPYLSQIERGLRKPSAEILAQIATGLRISAEALYVRAGILEPREYSPVLDALAADPDLSERQKQVLADIYASFRRGNVTDTTVAKVAEEVAADLAEARPAGSAATGRHDS